MIKHHTIKKRYVTTLNSQGLHIELDLLACGPSKINVQIRNAQENEKEKKIL